MLNEHIIRQGLSPQAAHLLTQLQLFDVIDSTQNHVMQNMSSGYVCVAEQQTAGRGRRGRTWVSPRGGNIYCSVGWTVPTCKQPGLSLAVGVAIVAALERYGVTEITLKWPNDVLHHGRKLAGILLETKTIGDTCHAAIGIGINLAMPAQAGTAIEQPWTDISRMVDGEISHHRLLALLLNELLPLLADFTKRGFAPYRQRWQMLDAYAGQVIQLHTEHTIFTGQACGINANGALLLDTDTGQQVVHSGEVLKTIRQAGKNNYVNKAHRKRQFTRTK